MYTMNKTVHLFLLCLLIALIFIIPYIIIESLYLFDIDSYEYEFSDEFHSKCGGLDVGCYVQTDKIIYNFLSCSIIESTFEYIYEGNTSQLLYSLPTNAVSTFYWFKCTI